MILALAGLVVGSLITWLFLVPKLGQRDESIEELEKSTEKHKKKLIELKQTISELEGAGESINQTLSQREHAINEMKERLTEFGIRSKEAVTERDRLIEELEASQRMNDAKISDLTKRVQEQESVIDDQKVELNQRIEAGSKMDALLRERDEQVNSLREEMTRLDNHTGKVITERDGHIDKLSNSLVSKDADIGRLRERLQEHENSLEDLRAQLSKRDELIQGQNDQIHEQNSHIKNLMADRADLDEQYQKIMTRAEDAESREVKLGSTLEAKELEFASLHQRTRRMRDDFTHIAGIGQKISFTLRNAGIKTFKKLSTTDVGRIREVLEAENPSLLRLTDPTTWPEQARIAADGDWEALSKLQNSIKATKPSR